MKYTKTDLSYFHAGHDAVVVLTTQAQDTTWTKLAKIVKHNAAYFRVAQISGFGPSQELKEGASIQTDSRVVLGQKDIFPVMWANAYEVTKQAQKSDIHNIIARNSKDIARSHAVTKNRIIWNILNNMDNTAYTGPDGKPLIAFDHPAVAGVAAQSNQGDGTNDLSLSVGNLETAWVQLMKQKDPRGLQRLNTGPAYLYVPIELEPLATRIVSSPRMAGTADNDINFTSSSRFEVIGSQFFDVAPTAWALRLKDDDQHELCVLTRLPLETESDYDVRTKTYVFTISEEIATFHKDWRGFWGTTP